MEICQMLTYFSYHIKKITFVNISTELIRKIFNYGQTATVMVMERHLPVLSFLLEKYNFIIGNNKK